MPMPELVLMSTPMIDSVSCWFAETTLVASALALVACFGARLRRLGLGPAARHALWLVVLVKLMTPPLLHWPWSRPWPMPISNPSAPAPLDAGRDAEPRPDGGLARAVGAGDDVEVVDFTFNVVMSGPISDGGANPALGASDSDAESRPSGAPPAVAPPLGRDWWSAARVPARWVVSAWLVGSIAIGLAQASRIRRFRRRLKEAVPAPAWLVEEADRIGLRLNVRVPEIRVVPWAGTPLLWCPGRPVLLVPGDLVKTLEVGRWRGILAHELAHLRRGDQWVSRLELAAGLIWWWNPLYWLIRHRLDAEAELACDAWVVWALPKDRLAYAESLFQICASLSSARSPAPALSVAGAGRLFERRLTMILRDRVVSCRPSTASVLAAALLALLALPSWSTATPVDRDADPDRNPTVAPAPDPAPAPNPDPTPDPSLAFVVDADDSDDEDSPKPAKVKKQIKVEAKLAKPKPTDVDVDLDVDVSGIEKGLEDRFGPDFEKKMEAIGEKIGKEMEKKFGPGSDFEKKMEAMGKEIEKKFGSGSDFEKKIEAMGKEIGKKFGPGSEFEKEIKEKFGPGSDFEKKIKAMGKEMEGKFGPGSEFEKQMKVFSKEMEKQFGPGSEFAEQLKDLEKVKAKAKAEAQDQEARASTKAREARASTKAREAKEKADRASVRAKAKAATSPRARRIEALEAQVNELLEELKRLKAQDEEDEEG